MIQPNSLRRYQWAIALAGLVALTAGLIFFRLTRADLQQDDGHYAQRAVGYFDYLASQKQTTPLQWFNTDPLPWWTKLSFHDHPPLVFAIQHVFFRLFGVSDFTARLPFGLAGLGAVVLLYAIGRDLAGKKSVGLMAATLTGASAFFIWSSRIGYLESVTSFFILLSVWMLVRAEKNPRWLPWWGLSVGLALITKYSALFLIPTFLVYILWRKRQWFRDWRFWISCGLALLVVSPVAYYNVRMWRLRGHPDVQWSALIPSVLPAAKLDWPVLFSSPRRLGMAANANNLFVSLRSAFSFPFVLLLGVGVLSVAWRVISGGRARRYVLPLLGLLFVTVFFLLTVPSFRYLPIVIPWLTLPAAVWLQNLFSIERGARSWAWWRKGAATLVVIVVVGELLFNWNTNHAVTPYGASGVTYAAYRQENIGFQQLARYLGGKIFAGANWQRARTIPRTFGELNEINVKSGDDIVLYDAGLLWFSTFWYLQGWYLYHNLAVVQNTDLPEGKRDVAEVMPWLQGAGVRRVYYVTGLTPAVYDPWAADLGDQLTGKIFARNLERTIAAGAPVKAVTIATNRGQPAFRVYEVTLNP